jgi:glycine hydroxymethyltransferase
VFWGFWRADTSAINPGGIRVGAPAMTTRGFAEPEFIKIVDFIDRAIKVAIEIQKSLPKEANRLKDWKAKLGDGSAFPELVQLKKEVNQLAGKYPLPALLE